jgi:hypothetical protein
MDQNITLDPIIFCVGNSVTNRPLRESTFIYRKAKEKKMIEKMELRIHCQMVVNLVVEG